MTTKAVSPRRRIAFDCETHLIRVGMLFPRVVCMTTAEYLGSGNCPTEIFGRLDAVRKFVEYLRDPSVVLCGYNTSYDIGVLLAEAITWARESAITAPATEDEITYLVFKAYEDERIVDVMVRVMLVDIARGMFQAKGQKKQSYSLQAQAERWCGIRVVKEDTWRLHYAFWTDKPLSEWVQDAIDYAILDAYATAQLDRAVTSWIVKEGNSSGEMPDEWRQTRAAWVLHLMAGWGVRIDGPMVATIKENLLEQRKVSYKIMDDWGIFKKDRKGEYKLTKKGNLQKDMKRLQALITEGYKDQGEEPPMTPGRVDKKTGLRVPAVKTDAETAEESGHPAAIAFASIANCEKLLSTYIPILERGANGAPVTSSPNVLVASGRTSWRDPNWQNPPKVGGVRECVVARPGMVLCGADLDTVELRALAQTCLETLGWSEMAAAIQRGEDLHLSLAAEILGMDYLTAKAAYDAGDPIVSDARQNAKAANFGFPGGMGAKKFRITQLESNPNMTVEEAYDLREAWFKRWPEMRRYLQNAGDIVGDFGPSMVEQPWSGRIRGGLDYCSCANTFFQGRVADGTKLALWRLSWACYVDKKSPLYGCRIVLFLHDEVIMEVPEDRAHECAQELVRILVGAVQEVIPDVPITSAAVLTRRWFKGAKPVKVAGRLVPCKPEKDTKGKTKWVHDPDPLVLAA